MTSPQPGDADLPWWGTAAAATQCEGAAPRSDWAGWEAEGRAPASRDGNGFRTRYEDDLALLAEHGVRHHRLTVEWARLEPSPGRWDDDEVAHLRRVLGAAHAAGVAPWVCLLHGSAPGWFTDDQRGWLDDKAVLAWARHVDRVAEAVGDLVAGWVPIHEPALAARLGYGDGTFPPGRRNDDDHRGARAALLAAEAEAARLLRSGPVPVSVSADADDPHEGDDLLVVSAPVDGVEAALERTTEASPEARLLVVTSDPETSPAGGATSGDGTGDGAGSGDGTGPGSGGAEAELRQRRLERAVAAVAEAQASGVPIVGAFHQPAVDGYEWHRGFDARLGLFDRDRNPRPALEALPRSGRGS
jgi:beta-glucosidase